MTRKHFELIADSIDNLHYQGFTSQQVEAVAQQLAKACAASSSRFDRGRFVAACTKSAELVPEVRLDELEEIWAEAN